MSTNEFHTVNISNENINSLKLLSGPETIMVLKRIINSHITSGRVNSNIESNPTKSHLLVAGKAEDFCLFFADICKNNGRSAHFVNEFSEVAHFIFSKIKFTNSTPSVNDIYEFLTEEEWGNRPVIDYQNITLRWKGNKNQLLYVIDKMRSTKDYNCNLSQSLKAIAEFLFSNVEFSKPVKSYRNLYNVLKRKDPPICSKKNRILNF